MRGAQNVASAVREANQFSSRWQSHRIKTMFTERPVKGRISQTHSLTLSGSDHVLMLLPVGAAHGYSIQFNRFAVTTFGVSKRARLARRALIDRSRFQPLISAAVGTS
jgi:hypothetical protein